MSRSERSIGAEPNSMSGRVFFDTNDLVYANDQGEPSKQSAARALIKKHLLSDTAVISVQVLGEFWVSVTRKIKMPLSRTVATEEIKLFQLMHIVDLDFDLFKDALRLQQIYSISHWDAQIISAAISAGCGVVYSEDLADGQKYGDVVVRNPFLI